ncbi:hypothetical protein LINGRAHAP2_LOCUS7273, partial [Linum grandiflorum]
KPSKHEDHIRDCPSSCTTKELLFTGSNYCSQPGYYSFGRFHWLFNARTLFTEIVPSGFTVNIQVYCARTLLFRQDLLFTSDFIVRARHCSDRVHCSPPGITVHRQGTIH